MSSLFDSTKPIATAARPAYEFRSEMTVGMSAPPIGMINSTPNASERRMSDANAGQNAGLIARYTPEAMASASSARLTRFWLR